MSLTRGDGDGPVLDTIDKDDVQLICNVNVLPVDLGVYNVFITYPNMDEFTLSPDDQHPGVYKRTVTDVHPRDSGNYTCTAKITPRPSDPVVTKTSRYSLTVTGKCIEKIELC